MRTRTIVVLLGATATVAGVMVAAPANATTSAAPTVTGVSPTAGRSTGASTVTVEGTGLSTVTRVYFGSASSTRIAHISSTLLRVTSPAHAVGRVDVRVQSSSGTSRATPSDDFDYASGAPRLNWSKPATVYGASADGYLRDISCATADHCVLITTDGYADTWNGHVMSRRRAAPYLDAGGEGWSLITCPNLVFCAIASTANGRSEVAFLRGSTWSAPVTVDTRSPLADLSCSSSQCVGIASDGGVVLYRDGAWRPPTGNIFAHHAGEHGQGVSCPADTFCLLLGDQGDTEVFNGTRLGTPESALPPKSGFTGVFAATGAVDCSMPTYCVVNGEGVPFIRRGSTWGLGQSGGGPGRSFMLSVSCASPSLCVAAGNDSDEDEGVIPSYVFNGAAASSTGDPFTADATVVSCPTEQLCMSGLNGQISVARRAT